MIYRQPWSKSLWRFSWRRKIGLYCRGSFEEFKTVPWKPQCPLPLNDLKIKKSSYFFLFFHPSQCFTVDTLFPLLPFPLSLPSRSPLPFPLTVGATLKFWPSYSIDLRANNKFRNPIQTRRLNGALNRVPMNLYQRIWKILERSIGGIVIAGHVLPQVSI